MLYKKLIFILINIAFINVISSHPLKILHLSFHQGCIKDFEYVAQQLNLELTSLFVPELGPKEFDGESHGSALYSIGHNRAEKIWLKHYDFFHSFDVIMTSDTAPLARIFLQNNWKKPLIVWICNRFDYYDAASRDCRFPDPEYYQLFREALHKKNVALVAYTRFEHHYTKIMKGIDTGSLTIKPCAMPDNTLEATSIPGSINQSETFFIPPYHNDTIFCNLAAICQRQGIPVYNGRYNGPGDLKNFKGIIHIPYAWSNLALFENLQNGVPYFIPSKKFLLELKTQGDFFFYHLDHSTIDFSEWYAPEHKDLFVYFDSWKDLAHKIKSTNFEKRRAMLKKFGKEHHDKTLQQWQNVFDNFNYSKE